MAADAQSREYGLANPTLTYQVAGAGPATATRRRSALATTATPAINVGSYRITQGTLAASSNYALNYTGNNLTVASGRPR